YFDAYNALGYSSDESQYLPGGSVINGCNVTMTGGNASAGAGGAGGYAELYTQSSAEFPQHVELVINTGTMSMSGGTGTTAGGAGGWFEWYGRNGVLNSGTITANGGDASASDGEGGSISTGSDLGFFADDGPVNNSAAITSNGGNGTGSAGSGGNSYSTFYF